MYKNSLKDMTTLTRELKDMIKTPRGFVGTVNADGTPNLEPKRSTRVL
jgi:predicted pyridoxine 5'-phosphate oxidase superfamily flavin-nucleotide-binding protein